MQICRSFPEGVFSYVERKRTAKESSLSVCAKGDVFQNAMIFDADSQFFSRRRIFIRREEKNGERKFTFGLRKRRRFPENAMIFDADSPLFSRRRIFIRREEKNGERKFTFGLRKKRAFYCAKSARFPHKVRELCNIHLLSHPPHNTAQGRARPFPSFHRCCGGDCGAGSRGVSSSWHGSVP